MHYITSIMVDATARRLLYLLCPAVSVIGIYDLDHGLNRLDMPVIAVSILVIGPAIVVLGWVVWLRAGTDDTDLEPTI